MATEQLGSDLRQVTISTSREALVHFRMRNITQHISKNIEPAAPDIAPELLNQSLPPSLITFLLSYSGSDYLDAEAYGDLVRDW